MAQLIKGYPAEPHRNRILFCGSLEEMVSHLNKIEARTERKQLSECGTVFTEYVRYDDFTLKICIYKNVDTAAEETIDVDYSVFL
jgi:hypothetical protein